MKLIASFMFFFAAQCSQAAVENSLRLKGFLRSSQMSTRGNIDKADAAVHTQTNNTHPSIYSQLQSELYQGVSPYKALDGSDWGFHPDWADPHSHLKVEVVQHVLRYTNAKFWLELGSFIGNSAITTAKLVGDDTSIICMDPFTGDVNMWAWNKNHQGPQNFNFLEMDANGIPRIYETFLSNLKSSGFANRVLPIRITSVAGMRLLPRLVAEGRLATLPKVIYLDSAHEKDETLMEVTMAFDLVQSGGLVLGDDWDWVAVRDDVIKFAQIRALPAISPELLSQFDVPTEKAQQPVNGVILVLGQWMILKH